MTPPGGEIQKKGPETLLTGVHIRQNIDNILANPILKGESERADTMGVRDGREESVVLLLAVLTELMCRGGLLPVISTGMSSYFSKLRPVLLPAKSSLQTGRKNEHAWRI